MYIKERVREFVRENFFLEEGEEILDGASLLNQGIVDSTGILEVIMYLESTFGILVEDAEIVPENLDSIDAIAGFVARKRGPIAAEAS